MNEKVHGIIVFICVLGGFIILINILTHPAKKGKPNTWGDFFRNAWALIVVVIIVLICLKSCGAL